MAEPIRISPKEAREKSTSGVALLVCGYDNEDKFRANHLGGTISFADFESRLPSLKTDQEIIFYCA
jgi:hypothetical protein